MSPSTRSFTLLLLFFWLCFTVLKGQHIECTFDEHFRSAQASDSQFRKSVESYEHSYQNYVNENYKHIKNDAFLHLPIVVHVVHSGDSLGSISNPRDEVIIDAIEYTNQIFRQTNTEAEFQNPNYGADTEISFCLASRDEDGNPTSGITRHFSKEGEPFFSSNINWDKEKYINVEITELSSFCGFYEPGNADIITVSTNCLEGSTTLAHELGHYFSLMHIFSSTNSCDNENCISTGDYVCDTPPQENSDLLAQAGFEDDPCMYPGNSCQSDEDDMSEANPYRSIALGGLGDQPDAHRNLMGYGASCRTNFTTGQALRMRFNLMEEREMLWSQESQCSQPFISMNDAGVDRLGISVLDDCDELVSLNFDLKNYGNSKIENVDLLLFQNGQLTDSMRWEGTLNAGDTASLSFENLSTVFGENLFEVRTFNPNSTVDDNPASDSNFLKYYPQNANIVFIGLDEEVGCDLDTVQIGIEITGSDENMQYLWRRKNGLIDNDQQGNPIINVSVSDSFFLNIYNENFECEWMESIFVAQGEDIFGDFNINSLYGDITCRRPSTFLSSSVGSGVDIKWYTEEGPIESNFASYLKVDSAGEYRCKVTNQSTGCHAISDWYTVKDLRMLPEVNLEIEGEITCFDTNVLISVLSSDFDSIRYTYIWKDLRQGEKIISEITGQFLTVSEPGLYGLEVLDNMTLCSSQAEIEVLSEDNIPTITIDSPLQIDFNQQDTIRISARVENVDQNYTYHWTTDNGEIVDGEYSLEPLVQGYGNYTLKVENILSGCVQSRLLNLIPSHFIDLNFFCSFGSKINVNLKLAVEFEMSTDEIWYNPNGEKTEGNMLVDTLSGTYVVEYFNGRNTVRDSIRITEEMLFMPVAVIDPIDDVSCITEEYTLSATNSVYNEGDIFIWRDGYNRIIGNDVQATGIGADFYRLDVVNKFNNCYDRDFERVRYTDMLTFAFAGPDAYLSCVSDSVMLGLDIEDVNLEFRWYLIDGVDTLFLQATPTLMVGKSGKYFLEVYNSQDACSAFDEVIVFDEAEELDVRIGSIAATEDCTSYQTLLTIGQAHNYFNYSYTWTLPNGEQSDKFIFHAEQEGAYILDFKALHSGCEASDTFYYEAPANLELQFSKKRISCHGDTDGAIILSPIGGVPPYELEGNQTEFYDLSSGLYEFEVTDSLGCKANVEILMTDPDPLMISDFVSTGTGLEVEYEGGVSPYTIAWNTGEDDKAISSLEFGLTYTVTITDNNGCQVAGSTEYLPIQTGSSISILPNPARDEIQVYTEDNSFDGPLKIYDVAGACVKSVDNYHSLDKIDISQLSNGVYVVVLSDAENKLVARLVVID